MSRHDIDEEEDDDLDPEGPDPEEMDSSDEANLDVCPHCRKLITEDAERCPHCGDYITPGDAPLTPAAWVVIVVLLVLVMSGLIWIF